MQITFASGADFVDVCFQGAIQGPTEFAEGLALGCRALLGHTVGGAAGALSKITGTLGKGIAALTLDEEFKQKRREMMNKRPHDVGEAFARSGKGLVMVSAHSRDSRLAHGTLPILNGFIHGLSGILRRCHRSRNETN